MWTSGKGTEVSKPQRDECKDLQVLMFSEEIKVEVCCLKSRLKKSCDLLRVLSASPVWTLFVLVMSSSLTNNDFEKSSPPLSSQAE